MGVSTLCAYAESLFAWRRSPRVEMSPLCQSNGILGAFIQCADTVHFVPYSCDVFMYRLYMTPPVTNKQPTICP